MFSYVLILFLSLILCTFVRESHSANFFNKERNLNSGLTIKKPQANYLYQYPQWKPQITNEISNDYENINKNPFSVLPLLQQSSSLPITIAFFFLIWRSVSLYENNHISNNKLIIFNSVLFVALNIICFLSNMLFPLKFKNQLKVVIVLNMAREWVGAFVNSISFLIAFFSNHYAPSDYLGKLLLNYYWGILCYSFCKSRWVQQSTPISINKYQNQ